MATSKHTATAAERRFKYGFNVTLALIIAVTLVIAVNFIIDRAFQRASPKVRHVMRWDVTTGRRYSLSPQTEKLLANMETDVRIVSLLNPDDERLTRAIDLLKEYSSSKIELDIINPATDLLRRDAFYKSVHDRFGDELKSTEAAIEKGVAALEQTRSELAEQAKPLSKLSEDASIPQGPTQTIIQRVYNSVRVLTEDGLDEVIKQSKELAEGPLPDYASAKRLLTGQLQTLDENLFAVAISEFRRAADREGLPGHAKEQVLELIESFEASRRNIAEALTQLRDAEDVDAYDDLRRQVGRDTIVFLTEDEHRVLRALDLFRADLTAPQNEGDVVQEFQGEERITGALASLNLKNDAMVVLATASATSQLLTDMRSPSPDGYDYVSAALQNSHFDVRPWRAGMQNPRMPPQQAPEPEEGQKAVWVFVTPVQPEPPSQFGPMAEQQVANKIRQRLEQGDGVMLILSPAFMMFGGGGSPFDDLLKEFGLDAQLDRMIFTEVTDTNRRRRPIAQYTTNQWPDAHPIGKAVQGMPGAFMQGSPLLLPSEEKQKELGVNVWPLVTIQAERMWAATDFMRGEEPPRYDESTARDQFVIAAAAEKDGKRLIVTTDRLWATNQIAMFGENVIPFGRIIMFPGNAEFFVNSTYWLAGIDEMIAASARRQDIRRVDAMDAGTEWGVQLGLIIGMPMLVLAAGLSVWMTRRS